MKCVICTTGVTRKGKTTVMLERNASLVIIKDVPAQVCTQCGEAYFDEKTTHELYHIANNALKNGSELEVLKMKAA